MAGFDSSARVVKTSRLQFTSISGITEGTGTCDIRFCVEIVQEVELVRASVKVHPTTKARSCLSAIFGTNGRFLFSTDPF